MVSKLFVFSLFIYCRCLDKCYKTNEEKKLNSNDFHLSWNYPIQIQAFLVLLYMGVYKLFRHKRKHTKSHVLLSHLLSLFPFAEIKWIAKNFDAQYVTKNNSDNNDAHTQTIPCLDWPSIMTTICFEIISSLFFFPFSFIWFLFVQWRIV